MQDSQKAKLEEILFEEMTNLKLQMTECLASPVSIAMIEKGLLSNVLTICNRLLSFVIESKLMLGHGHISGSKEGEKLTNKGSRERNYLSLFGLLRFNRPAYYSKESGMVYPLDEALGMPDNLWSYNLQEIMAYGASESNFRDSIQVLNQLLGLNLRGMDAERNIVELSTSVEEYYSQCPLPELSEATQCCSVSFDGKGVPKIKESTIESTPPSSRLNKGQKRGVKQMATVVVSSCFMPKQRSKDSIINGLMNWHDQEKPSATKANDKANDALKAKSKAAANENDNRWHTHIHRRAFLANQDQAIQYGLQRVKSQLKLPSQRFVVPIDGGAGLEQKVLHGVKEYGLETHFDGIILDIVHVSEYVWEVANALLGDKSSLRSKWVADVLADLLDSKTEKVMATFQKMLNKTKTSATQKEQIQKAITYFTNHAHKMDYKTYLHKGYPISSALVEATCKHLVKDRMEQSGMRWSDKGAQAMLNIRAVKLNGQLAEFISFVAKKNRKISLLDAA